MDRVGVRVRVGARVRVGDRVRAGDRVGVRVDPHPSHLRESRLVMDAREQGLGLVLQGLGVRA